jgi:hypothetical protein
MSKFKDFSYRKYNNKNRKNQENELWGVYIAKKILHTVCRSEEEARITTELLNRDPYFFERQDWNQYKSARSRNY